jgi:hypothetical protein
MILPFAKPPFRVALHSEFTNAGWAIEVQKLQGVKRSVHPLTPLLAAKSGLAPRARCIGVSKRSPGEASWHPRGLNLPSPTFVCARRAGLWENTLEITGKIAAGGFKNGQMHQMA